MSRRTGFVVAAAIAIGAAAIAALLVSLAPEPERRTPPLDVPFVQTAEVIAGSGAIPVYGGGTVRPSAEVDIAPQVGGRVVWVNPAFQSGRRLRADEVILRIEEADYVHGLREAEAALSARESEYLQAREEAAIARDEFARYARRQPGAHAAGPASPLTLKEPQLQAARAALERDKARVASAELLLSRTRVSAPFDGVVRDESVEVGELVGAGQSVGRLVAADAVEVVVPLTGADAALIPNLWATSDGAGDPGKRAAARVVADYGSARHAWEGEIDRAEATLSEDTRTINVVVRVPDPFLPGATTGGGGDASAFPLLVGKFVNVEIAGLAPEAYFRVARAALQPQDRLWTVRSDDRIRIVPIQILQRADDEIFVTGALEDGQAVVVGGIRFATDGMRVRTGTAPTP